MLKGLIETNKDKVVAIGECGLDYDRLNFCQADVQKKYFEAQLDLSGLFELPLFLHCRAAATDMLDILKKNQDKLCSSKGVNIYFLPSKLAGHRSLVDYLAQVKYWKNEPTHSDSVLS